MRAICNTCSILSNTTSSDTESEASNLQWVAAEARLPIAIATFGLFKPEYDRVSVVHKCLFHQMSSFAHL
jgi:hypothetical protein